MRGRCFIGIYVREMTASTTETWFLGGANLLAIAK
jgi:hypothetical protein